jgi:hypothetical protein
MPELEPDEAPQQCQTSLVDVLRVPPVRQQIFYKLCETDKARLHQACRSLREEVGYANSMISTSGSRVWAPH